MIFESNFSLIRTNYSEILHKVIKHLLDHKGSMQKTGDVTVSRCCIPALQLFWHCIHLKKVSGFPGVSPAVPFADFGGAASEDLLPRHGISTVQTQLRESANCKVGCQQSALCWSIAADFWRIHRECSKINRWKLTLMRREKTNQRRRHLKTKHPTHESFLHAEHSRLNFSAKGNSTSFLSSNELIVQFLRKRHEACPCYLKFKKHHPQVLLWPLIAHFSVPIESRFFVQSTHRIPPSG